MLLRIFDFGMSIGKGEMAYEDDTHDGAMSWVFKRRLRFKVFESVANDCTTIARKVSKKSAESPSRLYLEVYLPVTHKDSFLSLVDLPAKSPLYDPDVGCAINVLCPSANRT
jgi:hypothetical protein